MRRPNESDLLRTSRSRRLSVNASSLRLVGQLLSSVGNVLLPTYASHVASDAELGRFSLMYMILLATLGASRAAISEQVLLGNQGIKRSNYVVPAGAALLFAGSASVLVATGVNVSVVGILVGCLPLLITYDLLRFGLLRSRPLVVLIADAGWAAGFFVGGLYIVRTGGQLPGLISLYGLTAVPGLLLVLWGVPVVSEETPLGAAPLFRASAALTSVSNAAAGVLGVWLLGVTAGWSVLGELRRVDTLLAPIRLGVSGVPAVLGPKVQEMSLRDLSQGLALLMVVLSTAGLFILSVSYALPETSGLLADFRMDRYYLGLGIIASLRTGLNAGNLLLGLAVRARRNARAVVLAGAPGTVAAIGSPAAGYLLFGAYGAAGGLALAVLVAWVSKYRVLLVLHRAAPG